MKTKLFLALLSGFSILAKAESIPTNLIVWAKDGTKVAYAFAKKPKVTFTETNLVITIDDIEVNYSLENMIRFTYEYTKETAVRDLQDNEVSFKLDGNSLLFPDLDANSTIALYALNGTLIFKKTIPASGKYSFPLTNLNTGVYVVEVNGLTYKIIKK